MSDKTVYKFMATKNKKKEEFTFVDKIVRRIWFRYPWVDLDELISEANLALVVKAREYQEKKPDCDFVKFAYMRIEGAVKDYLRSLNWIVRQGKTTHHVYCFSGEKLVQKADRNNWEKGFIDDVLHSSDREYLYKLMKFLPSAERKVLKSVVSGKSLKSIAVKEKLSMYRIRNLYKSALDLICEYSR